MQPTEEHERQTDNPPAAEKILIGLWAVIDACQELLDAHLKPDDVYCSCALCTDADGLLYFARLSESCIEGELGFFPERYERCATEDERRGDIKGARFWRRQAKKDLQTQQAAAGPEPTVPAPDQASEQPTVTTVADNPFYGRS